jgi:hypothetical protein
MEVLYLFSLEALKNACVTGYDTLLRYDDSPNKLTGMDFHRNVLPAVRAKTADLTTFADALNISSNDIRLIAKGKWYLHWFAHHIYLKIKSLKEHCKNAVIPQCRSCRVGNYQDCLLKMKESQYQLSILQGLLLHFIDEIECFDVISRFRSLNA